MSASTSDRTIAGAPRAVADARAEIGERLAARAVGSETVAVTAAAGRILAHDVRAPRDVPGFDHAAMDGYAVRFADLTVTGSSRLRVAGRVLAGADVPAGIVAGTCMAIATGAPLPPGADTVVIRERSRLDGECVVLEPGTAPGANVRAAADDYARDQAALAAGTRLSAAQVGVLAGFGLASVDVRRRARVGVLTTGDELLVPGAAWSPGRRYDSNGPMLAALLEAHAAEVVARRCERDDPSRLALVLEDLADAADLVLTTGGVSAGDADFLPRLVAERGRVHFWKVRMRPGMPVLFGEIGGTPVFALPGNAVSVFATFLVLARPALAALCACPALDPPARPARLATALDKSHDRTEFRRARVQVAADGMLSAAAHPSVGSGALRSAAESDALVELAGDRTHFEAGTIVPVIRTTPEPW